MDRQKGLSAGAALFGALAITALAGEPALAHHVMGGQMPVTLGQGLLSGLGHPIIGLDHLAAMIAIGCLAAMQPRGAWLVIGYVLAMILGAAAHVRGATVPAAEVLVALSVIALGAVLAWTRPAGSLVAVALFAVAGLVHGYALGESIAGAEPAPLYAYFAGLALIQSAIALAVMAAARTLMARRSLEPMTARLIGAGIAGLGLAVLVQQITPGA